MIHRISSTIYAGAVDKCYKSVNYGENWTSTGTGLIGYCHSLIFASGGLFCGSDAGIYKSADGGLTWRESHSGIFEPSIWGLAVAPSAPGTVYASRRGAFFKSSDYGNSWSRLADTAGSDIFVNPVNADELLMEVNTPTTTPSGTVESNHISRSVDGGHSWDTIFNGTAFAANPTDFNRVFVLGTNAAGVYGLHKTTDGGNTWTSTGIQSRYAYRVAVDPANDNTVYLSGWYDRGDGITISWVDKSTDGGLSWTTVLTLQNRYINGITVDPASANRIYVTTEQNNSGLYRSQDYGATWQIVLPDAAADVEINPGANNEVYVAVDNYWLNVSRNGVWGSMDGGGSWQQMNNSGLTTTSTLDLEGNWTNRILYAGSGAGIFRTFLPATPVMPTISGTVKTAGGAGMPDVLLTFSSGGGTVTTGASGYYVQPVPVGWSGTVTPSKADFTFTPVDRSYTNVTANLGGEDYAEYVHMVSIPGTPNGLPRGEKDVSYIFASGGSSCAQGHSVEYQFDWGDGSFSGWSSAANAAHSWSTPGAYTVRVQARCSVDINVVSGWSPDSVVTILIQYTEADKYAVGDIDGDGLDEAAVDFGTLGVWLWNGGVWGLLTSSNPEHLIAGNLDGNADDEIVGDFGTDGIWAWDSGAWGQLSSQNAELMVSVNIDGDAPEELVVDLGHLGIWLWNGGSWSQLARDNPEYLMAANTDGDAADELVTGLGSLGLWLWNGGTWTQLTEDDPEHFVGADTDNDSRDEIVTDFGSLGLWLWNGGAWTYLSNDNPEFLAAGDVDLVGGGTTLPSISADSAFFSGG